MQKSITIFGYILKHIFYSSISMRRFMEDFFSSFNMNLLSYLKK